MNRKVAVFAFNGELMCFAHALLNSLDMAEKDYDVKLVIEGSAAGLIRDFEKGDTPFRNLYLQCIDKGLLDCVCRACAFKTGSLESAEKQGLPLCDEMSGHPGMARYLNEGYQIITF